MRRLAWVTALVVAAIGGGACFDGSTFAIELVVQLLELLHRLFLTILLRQLLGEHESNVVLVGTEVRKLFQRTKCLLHLRATFLPPGFVLPFRVSPIFNVLSRELRRSLFDLAIHRLKLGGVTDQHTGKLLRLGVRGGGLELLGRRGDLPTKRSIASFNPGK